MIQTLPLVHARLATVYTHAPANPSDLSPNPRPLNRERPFTDFKHNRLQDLDGRLLSSNLYRAFRVQKIIASRLVPWCAVAAIKGGDSGTNSSTTNIDGGDIEPRVSDTIAVAINEVKYENASTAGPWIEASSQASCTLKGGYIGLLGFPGLLIAK